MHLHLGLSHFAPRQCGLRSGALDISDRLTLSKWLRLRLTAPINYVLLQFGVCRMRSVPADNLASFSDDVVCRVNNQLEVVNHVLSLIGANLLPHETKLHELVQLGQAAVHCIADACAGREDESPLDIGTGIVDS